MRYTGCLKCIYFNVTVKLHYVLFYAWLLKPVQRSRIKLIKTKINEQKKCLRPNAKKILIVVLPRIFFFFFHRAPI